MAGWRILLVMVFGAICFGLGLATIIVPLTLVEDNSRWLWLAGLFAATVVMGTIFRLFLKSADRAMSGSVRR